MKLDGHDDERVRLRASARKAGEKFKGKVVASVKHYKSKRHAPKIWETLIYKDGSASCNCYAWKDYRTCWHVEGRRPAFK